ncbi:MAG: DNA glycosylase [Verrucomicrobiia bacterium]
MTNFINVSDFDLASTLECGQAFRWSRLGGTDSWFEGVVGREVWRLRQQGAVLEYDCSREASSRASQCDDSRECDSRLQYYLSLDRSLRDVVATFPADDEALQQAVQKHCGLRVIRQEPWETLASFIASSTKQIVQIKQIVANLARQFGEPIDSPFGTFHTFPTVHAVASASHQQLWDCKLGFRAKNLLAAARMIDDGRIDWSKISVGAASPSRLGGIAAGTPLLQPRCDYETAMAELLNLPGVGEKIASCVLLFACGFDQAFPIDVWIERALRRLYFARKHNVTHRQLREFTRTHFGPYAGWAQQYLFFQERTRGRQPLLDRRAQR